MLRWRLLLGSLFAAAIAALCWLDVRAETPGLVLWPLCMVLSGLTTAELLWMFAGRGFRLNGWLIQAGNWLIVGANLGPILWPAHPLGRLGWPLAALTLAMLLVFIAELARYRGPGDVVQRLGLSVFALVYVGVLLSWMAQLRMLDRYEGIVALATLILTVKLGDTGAYATGRLLGRHKLAPHVSPGKTIEGTLGGLAFSCLGAWLGLGLLLPAVSAPGAAPIGPVVWLGYGLIVGISGVIGDLAESLLKRDTGRKDSSAWMPGLGGVLDILDSLLVAGPVAYLVWICCIRPG